MNAAEKDMSQRAKNVAAKAGVTVRVARGLLRRLHFAGLEGADGETSLIYYLNAPIGGPYGADAGRVAAILRKGL